jgi:Na+:H+ antiporter, NhaA family
MRKNDLLLTGVIAGFGFTVALFVAGEAFTDSMIQGAAKMGAILSFSAAIIAFPLAKILGIKKVNSE